MKKRAERLLKEWCDTLLSYQVKTNTPYTNNSLLCPACHVVHGRIADLCFPLTVMWSLTGDESYLEEADKLIDWSEYNLKSPTGLWRNDAGSRWQAISAFSVLSMGDAIYHFGDTLPEKYKSKWMAIILRMADAFTRLDEKFNPVTNYYCGIATMFALVWRLTDNVGYYEESKRWISKALDRFDENGLLYGEGYPMQAEDGSFTVDTGYNMEESIPLLLRYADLTGEYIDLFRRRLRDHLEFLLPDGGIDDSFGTRHNKWTYWGSRTSDGLIEGLALVLDDPMFANACERVLSMYENCTQEGLLAMPMTHEAGEPTCLHHTFAHAKALAALVCAKDIPEVVDIELPCESDYGVKKFQNGRLLLASNGKFRATFSAINAGFLPEYAANGGGSMNLLYHKAYGVICAATSAAYEPSEPLNQQHLRHADTTPCMTAQFIVNGKMGCLDKNVVLSVEDGDIIARADEWQAQYSIDEDSVTVGLTCEDGIYNLPVVCKKDCSVILSVDHKTVKIGERLTVNSDAPLKLDPNQRVFNQVGGLLYLPISVDVKGKVLISITVQ